MHFHPYLGKIPILTISDVHIYFQMGWFNHQLGNIAHEWYHRRETSFLRLPRLEICRIEDDEAQRLTEWWLRCALSIRICKSNMAWLVVDYNRYTCRFAYMMLTTLSIFMYLCFHIRSSWIWLPQKFISNDLQQIEEMGLEAHRRMPVTEDDDGEDVGPVGTWFVGNSCLKGPFFFVGWLTLN